MIHSRRAAGFLVALRATGIGCAPIDTTGERLLLLGDERGAIEAIESRLERPSKREALDSNLLATAAMIGGDHARARAAFIDAGRIMGSFPSAQPGAVIGAEGSKIYLGDPYEVAMNSLYTSMLLIAEGDEENARAALKNGILADSDSGEEEYRSDIAALFILEAWLSLRVGKEDLARQDLEQVRELGIDTPQLDAERLRGANTLLVVDVGEGPQKVRSGRHGELATFVTPLGPETGLLLELGGEKVDPILGVDLAFQAITRGGREMDGILRGKAVFKDVTAVAGALILDDALKQDAVGTITPKQLDKRLALGGGLLLLSALLRPEADVRHWHLLPHRTYLWIGWVDPGRHHLSLRFRGPDGAPLPEFRQAWHHLPFSAEGPNVYYFRSGPRSGYGHAIAGNPPDDERSSP